MKLSLKSKTQEPTHPHPTKQPFSIFPTPRFQNQPTSSNTHKSHQKPISNPPKSQPKMAFSDQSLSLFSVLCIAMAAAVSSHSTRHMHYSPPNVTRLTDLFPRISVPQGFSTFFGAPNVKFLNNGSSFSLALDKSSGAGLASKGRYCYGFFSAAIKLPAGLSSGVVVAFYMSNADQNPHNHDEIDIELLGHERRNDWVIQTNVYANGSVRTGREEKFYLWFDPTQEHHYYSILWNAHHIVFLVDNIPVREFKQNPKAYPTKPMSLYATIWDGSEWATNGGKYPVNYKYGPFVVSFSEVEISGCTITPTGSCLKSCLSSSSSIDPVEGQGFTALSEDQRVAMDWARRKLMFYSYCKDTSRFKVMPPECN